MATLKLSRVTPYAALLPMALVAALGYLGAGLWTFYISLTGSRTFPSGHFIGLAQYHRLFDNERWMLSLHNLAAYGVLFVLACLVIGFLLAVFIDQNVKGEGVFRTIFLYPYAMSFVATGLVWQWLLTPGDGIDGSLRALGFHDVRFDWIVSQELAIYTVVIATVWQMSGLVMALMLAGLRGVDPEIWKAARLDGIPAWRVYAQIVLPMLWPTIATVLLLLATAVAKLYDAVVAMTQGGPGIASEVPAKFIMDHLFLRSNVGLASAGAIVLLVPVLALLAPYAYARSRKEAA
ncbi:sugar ABC transporter permease [Massilia sp. Root133]|uniref:carbohydrate ABC transporter permease n=1 Tax=unclassified Massilia TaxID=2609279 RepID=UPI0006F6E4D8|nr:MULTISPECIES: sugar ABC transporter permease [unclassified Massilia]KQY00879.1 sugar ABC transporter permease [Massilia sp. Root133]KQZ53093.1 sugar ABC transporter permease [Massilia sp. Root1485]